MNTQLTNRTALITAGGTGIGSAIAKGMAAEGANIVINYSRSEQEANDTVAEITNLGGKAIAVRSDISQADQVTALFGRAQSDIWPCRHPGQQCRSGIRPTKHCGNAQESLG